MASSYTENYGLCQWEPGDNFVRTEFNQDNARIDAALAELEERKLGPCEVIKTFTTGNSPTRRLTMDLSNVSWDQWTFVGFFFDYLPSAETNSAFYVDVNQGQTKAYSPGGDLMRTAVGPFLLVFLPFHDKNRQVQTFCSGDPGGAGYAECTFAEMMDIRLTYNTWTYYLPEGKTIQLLGIR